MTDCDVLIIGAGASGLAAAYRSAAGGKYTIVLERGAIPARKIYATGNGRCNYTNKAAKGYAELVKVMSSEFGIEPAEEDGRIYPRSFEAASVAEALVSAAERAGTGIACGAEVTSCGCCGPVFTAVCSDGSTYRAGTLILATGGKAGIQYGCYGDGYGFAKSFGHRIIKPIPALDGLVCGQDIEAIHGVRVKARASLLQVRDEVCKETASETGEVQFTKNGISGICVMDLSRELRLRPGTSYVLSLDLFPEKSLEELTALLRSRREEMGCGISWLVPKKLKEYLHTRMAPGDHGIAAMAALAKDLRFDITASRGWKTAQTTCGGVPLKEVDPESFESLKQPGLYITGELLDYDGPCGGFNLNWALRSGLAAGSSAAKR